MSIPWLAIIDALFKCIELWNRDEVLDAAAAPGDTHQAGAWWAARGAVLKHPQFSSRRIARRFWKDHSDEIMAGLWAKVSRATPAQIAAGDSEAIARL